MKKCKENDGDGKVSDSTIIPGLPNEIALDCLARIPRLMHQKFTRVSRSWKTLLTSNTLNWNASPGLPTNYVYVNLLFSIGDQRFFAWNLEDRACLPLPAFPTNLTCAKFVVSRGRLFSIGGLINSANSAEVWAYDPCVNEWESVASLKLARYEPAVVSIAGKIYVMGGGVGGDLSDWAEVYDPEVGAWTSLAIPCWRFFGDVFCRDSAVVNGKLYGMCYGGLGFIFDPISSSITIVSSEAYESSPCDNIHTLFSTWNKLNQKTAVVKGILFAYFDGKIRGYDFDHNTWLPLQGTGKRLRNGMSKASLVNVEEKLCVIRKNANTIIFACLDILKIPGILRCNVLWCHSEASSGRPWSIDACVSLAEPGS